MLTPQLLSPISVVLMGKVLERSSPSKLLGWVIKMLLRTLLLSLLLLKITPACMLPSSSKGEGPLMLWLSKEPTPGW